MYRSKYPRTFHLSWSHPHSDDKTIPDTSIYEGMEIVVTEKLDGENTTIYPDGYLHARSIDSRHNYTRDWAKKMASILSFDIPKGERFVFENVAYYHSIEYNDLESFCYLLSVWTDDDYCLEYDTVLEYAEILDLATPKIFYRGVFDEKVLKEIAENLDLNTTEGFVFRNVNRFHIDDFQKNTGKFVREGHVQTSEEHWLKNTYPNKLSKNKKIKPFYMG